MKQSNIFGSKKSAAQWVLYVDGASRNNPGPAGAGIYLQKDNQTVAKEGFYLGAKTNNQAEYLALLLGLHFLHQYADHADQIRIASDSELLVKQIRGNYRVRHANIMPLYALAQKLLQPFTVQIMHVVRTDNAVADMLANKGIDEKKPVPDSFIALLQAHDITL